MKTTPALTESNRGERRSAKVLRFHMLLWMLQLHQSVDECFAANFQTSLYKPFDRLRRSAARHHRGLDAHLMTDQYFSARRVNCIRGGGMDDLLHDDRDRLVGVIDVRPTTEEDCIMLVQVHKRDNIDSNQIVFAKKAIFPVVSEDDFHIETSSSPEEMEQSQAAASSRTIGSLCSRIYLIISYDFKKGKTVLHRTLGGIKLMNLVDGVRKRWDECAASKQESCVTELVILLVPSNEAEADESVINCFKANELFCDIPKNNEWKSEGVQFLTDRLKMYFELGGAQYKGIDPFGDIDIMAVNKMAQPSTSQRYQSDFTQLLEDVLRHFRENLMAVIDSKRQASISTTKENSQSDLADILKEALHHFEQYMLNVINLSRENSHSLPIKNGICAGNDMTEIVKRHMQLHSINEVDIENEITVDNGHFQSLVKRQFESFGGVGTPAFLQYKLPGKR